MDGLSSARLNIPAIVAMMVCVFALGSAEYAVVGVLPDIATGLGISVPDAGLLVTVYAVTVAVSGPILTLVTVRVPRKRLMIALMVVFGVGNLACAFAANYGLLIIGRVVSALALSTFAAAAIIVVVAMVPPERIASAISWVAGGLILAVILGAPVGTLVGQQFGWRATFWSLVGLSIVGILALASVVPSTSSAGPRPRIADELRILRRPVLLAALGIAVLGQMGLFTVYTYIATLLTDLSGFTPTIVTVLLFVFGGGGLLGNVVGGRLADRSVMGAMTGLLIAMAVVLALSGFVASSQLLACVMVFLLGALGFSVVPAYQSRVLGVAEGSAVAVATNTSGINVGIALGSALGGVVIAAGLGLANLGWIGAIPTALAALAAGATFLSERRRAETDAKRTTADCDTAGEGPRDADIDR